MNGGDKFKQTENMGKIFLELICVIHSLRNSSVLPLSHNIHYMKSCQGMLSLVTHARNWDHAAGDTHKTIV